MSTNMKKEKISIFFVNSLSNGGAERVVSSLANGMAQMGKKVIIYTVKDNKTYEMNREIEVKKLGKVSDKTIFKLLQMPFIIKKINLEIKNLEKKYDIEVITSHLKYSHMLCRYSKVKNRTIYVLHNTIYAFDKYNSKSYKRNIKKLYDGMQITTVSKGIEKEVVNDYNVSTSTISTIYNPVDIKIIEENLKEDSEVNIDNYFLFCGRFNHLKRPLLAIEVFYKGNFYKNYKMIMIGQGELEGAVEEKIREYGLEGKVMLLGWQANPYKYMKNATLMINTSESEGFPMTFIEAFACNCPVVSFDIKYGPNELLTGNLSRYLVEKDNINEMIDVINNALKNYPKNLTEKIESYKTSTIVEQYYKQYSEWNKK